MFPCEICCSSFTLRHNRTKHMKKYHPQAPSNQALNGFSGSSRAVPPIPLLKRAASTSPTVIPAKKVKMSQPILKCNACQEEFATPQLFAGHVRSQRHLQIIATYEDKGIMRIASAFRNRMASYRIPSPQDHTDIPTFLESSEEKFIRLVERQGHITAKVNIELFGLYTKPGDEGAQTELKSFNAKFQVITPATELREVYGQLCSTVKTKSEEFQERDSGWALLQVSHLEVNLNKYTPIRGSSYIELPQEIKKKKACINVQNKDEACFAWAVTAALHPVDHGNAPQRATSYPHYREVLNLTGMEFPFEINNIPKFELLNNMSINVYGLEFNTANNRHDVVGPIYFSKSKRDTHINLLYIEDGEKSHYVWIKHLSRLVAAQVSSHKSKMYLCDGCLTFFPSEVALLAHSEHDCNKICTVMPTTDLIKNKNGDMVPGNLSQFTNFNSKMRVAFTVYADFESLLTPIETCEPNPNLSYTNSTHVHTPYSFAYYIKCSFNQNLDKFVTYTGLDCPKIFMEKLTADAKFIYENYLKPIIPMSKLSPGEQYLFDSATECHICEKNLDAGDKVADHCHLSGKFVGAAHSKCNLNYKIPKFLPIFFHNLSGYDAHLFIKEFGLDNEKIDVIPQNKEKYISFSKSIKVDQYTDKRGTDRNIYLKLRFLDSIRFMSSSLEKLAKNLKPDQLINVRKHFPIDNQFDLVTKKGVFPYQYMDSLSKLEETKLPPQKFFFNSLANTDITAKEYEHAQNVWQHFNCRNLREYSDLYLKTDVLLLADIFENFRDVCLKAYNLDPAHYYTAPGLSWDAMLKLTDIKLELLTDIDMHHFVRKGIRGGISQCSLRHARANNKYMQDYDRTKPSTYMTYWDANNLYGWAMSECLPYGGFEWLSADQIQNFHVENIPDNSPIGYFLEVDIEYPQNLHDLHNDLPFLVENMVPPGSKFNNTKLIPNLNNKSKYIIHYRNLKQALSNGLKLSKINRVISFKQSDWLKKYIDLNTSMRQLAANDFEKDFFKLMNNSVFGKTMENVDKRVDVKLVNHWEDIGKRRGVESLIAKLNFNCCSIFSENLVAIQLDRLKVIYNKPIYVGFSVLDLSKLLMYNFYYENLKPKYGKGVNLCYMDTDSLILRVTTDDLYDDMKQDLDKFDTSNFDIDNKYGIPLQNKAVLGLFKDELGGKLLTEFVGLRAKMYAVETPEQLIKKAKGVKKCVVVQDLDLSDYKNCLFKNELSFRKQNLFRSIKHTIFSITQNKLALSPHDDKRNICADGVQTLAWGHKDIV